MCQIGTADELVHEVRRTEAAGVDELLWQVVPGFEDEPGHFAHEVVAPYRASRLTPTG